MIFNNTIEIILPKFDNDKKIIDWSEELKKVGLAFGGYTLFNSGINGVWYDGKDRYSDENMILRLDYLRLEEGNIRAFKSLLSYGFKTQLSLYVRLNNRTTFLDLGNYKNFLKYLIDSWSKNTW